jgi:hypothetical protein
MVTCRELKLFKVFMRKLSLISRFNHLNEPIKIVLAQKLLKRKLKKELGSGYILMNLGGRQLKALVEERESAILRVDIHSTDIGA